MSQKYKNLILFVQTCVQKFWTMPTLLQVPMDREWLPRQQLLSTDGRAVRALIIGQCHKMRESLTFLLSDKYGTYSMLKYFKILFPFCVDFVIIKLFNFLWLFKYYFAFQSGCVWCWECHLSLWRRHCLEFWQRLRLRGRSDHETHLLSRLHNLKKIIPADGKKGRVSSVSWNVHGNVK